MMEIDFLNIGGKDLGVSANEESRGGCPDSAFSVGSAVQWPLLNNVFNPQQYMPFKTPEEQKPKNILFSPISATKFQPFSAVDASEANQKTCTLQASQKYFDMDRHGVQQFAIHACQNQDINTYCAATHHANDEKFSSVSHPSIPITMSSPFFKVHGSSSGHKLTGTTVKHQSFGSGVPENIALVGSEVGAFFPRKMLEFATTTAQITIFYAGSVNVYDNVPCDKAQAVMLMASEGCKAAANAVHPRAEAPVLHLTKESVSDGLSIGKTPNMATSHVVSPCSGLSTTHFLASHIGYQSCVPADDKVGAKSMEVPSQNDLSKNMKTSLGVVTAAIIMPIAVPQARKASLARFLEKRKERASSAVPYSCGKKALENPTPDVSAITGSYSSGIGNRDCSGFIGKAKNCNDDGDLRQAIN